MLSFVCITMGDILAKKWVYTSNLIFAFVAVICYMGSTICYLPLLKEKGLIISTLVWTIGTIAVGTAIGLAYGETLTGTKCIGMILGAVSIVLLCL